MADDIVKALQGVAGSAAQGRLGRHHLADRVRRPRLGPASRQRSSHEEQAAFGVSSGVFAVGIGMAGPTLIAHGTDEQKAALPAGAAARRRGLVPAVQRARRRVRPRRRLRTRADARRRRVGGQRPEGVDVRRPLQRLRHPARPHRPRRAQAPGHHLLPAATCDTPGIEVRPLRQINGRPTSTRSSSPTSASPTTASSATSTRAGGVAMTTLANERATHRRRRAGASFTRARSRCPRPRARRATRWSRQRLAEVVHGASSSSGSSATGPRPPPGRGEPPGPRASIDQAVRRRATCKRIGDVGCRCSVRGGRHDRSPASGTTPERRWHAAVPHLALRPHRRRHRRDPAQHHRRAGPRAASPSPGSTSTCRSATSTGGLRRRRRGRRDVSVAPAGSASYPRRELGDPRQQRAPAVPGLRRAARVRVPRSGARAEGGSWDLPSW